MITSLNIGVSASKPLPPDIELKLEVNSRFLSGPGYVLPVIVQTPSILCAPPLKKQLKTATVIALLDTGASRTSISDVIAKNLELEPVGFSSIATAAGPKVFPDYAVDILFPNSSMENFIDIMVCSCHLPYKSNPSGGDVMAASNIGVLIGRDIMARWNIVWHGPSSSVFISD